ncbi:RNA methyltransferase [Aquirhabdus parva]|uniref:tRNA (cytidine/uridine-2'-O-)-methyltransferase TrmJ n=2 Tax=Aquirhabdus parva TaxID=2283318 RepID=A0A345PBD2_9GAMM|nr:RNA methyltransferase [Aquirhabdus parva]
MVNTTLPANIGAAARAMKTMGLSQLTLVNPKIFPSPDAIALASGAADVVENATIVDTLEQALSDCVLVFGTSARSRTIPWPLLEARAATKLAIDETVNGNIAIVFGREDRGLTNEELAQAQYHLTIPVNEEYGVLNVAAAIQVICYELRMHALSLENLPEIDQQTTTDMMPLLGHMAWDEPLVDQSMMQQFYSHLEAMLTNIDFLDPNNPRLLPLRLRRLFGRIRLDRMEYNLLRGIFGRVQALSKGTWPPQSLTDAQKTEKTSDH